MKSECIEKQESRIISNVQRVYECLCGGVSVVRFKGERERVLVTSGANIEQAASIAVATGRWALLLDSGIRTLVLEGKEACFLSWEP